MVAPEIPWLRRRAHGFSYTEADRDDLVQETLLRAYVGIDRFDGRNPRAWLNTIMRNVAISQWRKNSKTTFSSVEFDLMADASSMSVEDEVTHGAAVVAVVAAVDALPAPQAEVVRLVDLQGHGGRSVAESLGIPFGTVMSRLHRGRMRLRHDRSEDTVVA